MPEKSAADIHQPVLLNETVEGLAMRGNQVFVDATLGLGGHSQAILRADKNIRVIGIDHDLEAIEFAEKRLAEFAGRIEIFHDNFSELKNVLNIAKVQKVDGILADLGVSSLQFDSGERGFSFRFDAPLDMRMNAADDVPTAAELLAELSEFEIARIIYEYGEERLSRRIARRIVEKREAGEAVRSTGELAALIEKTIGRKPNDKIHPATRTFQALRIRVNRELEVLEGFLSDAIEVLKKDGNLAVITFHSLEDRIVKRTFQKMAGKCSCPPRFPGCVCGAQKAVEILTRKPIVADDLEIAANPRARSAKLRVCRKLN